MSSTERKRLLIAGGVLIAALAPLVFFKAITTAEAINITVVSFLVFATFMYAKRTAETANAAKQQADASMKMAEEMKEQTETLKKTISLSVRPSISLIVFNIAGQHNYLFEPPNLLEFEVRNTGKGPAMNVAITCEAKMPEVEYTKIESPYLNVGDKPRYSITRIRKDSDDKLKTPYLLLNVIYNDQLGESWRTTLQIDLNGQWKSGETITEELGKPK